MNKLMANAVPQAHPENPRRGSRFYLAVGTAVQFSGLGATTILPKSYLQGMVGAVIVLFICVGLLHVIARIQERSTFRQAFAATLVLAAEMVFIQQVLVVTADPGPTRNVVPWTSEHLEFSAKRMLIIVGLYLTLLAIFSGFSAYRRRRLRGGLLHRWSPLVRLSIWGGLFGFAGFAVGGKFVMGDVTSFIGTTLVGFAFGIAVGLVIQEAEWRRQGR